MTEPINPLDMTGRLDTSLGQDGSFLYRAYGNLFAEPTPVEVIPPDAPLQLSFEDVPAEVAEDDPKAAKAKAKATKPEAIVDPTNQ